MRLNIEKIKNAIEADILNIESNDKKNALIVYLAFILVMRIGTFTKNKVSNFIKNHSGVCSLRKEELLVSKISQDEHYIILCHSAKRGQIVNKRVKINENFFKEYESFLKECTTEYLFFDTMVHETNRNLETGLHSYIKLISGVKNAKFKSIKTLIICQHAIQFFDDLDETSKKPFIHLIYNLIFLKLNFF